MLQKERRDRILEILERRQYAGIQALADEVYASAATVRRDVKRLEAEGLVSCSYGGVSILQSGRKNVPLPLRRTEHAGEKRRIARKAAELVRPGDTVFIDGSSTAMNLAEFLQPESGLTVFTYCAATAARLARRGVTVYCVGGLYSFQSSVCTGAFAERNFRSVTADVVFLSSQGLCPETGAVMDSSEEETRLRRVMMEQSRRRVLLCDGSKLGLGFPFILANVDEMNDFVSDAELPGEFRVNRIRV